MAELKVKGTILVDLVRLIRGNKDFDWNKYLKPEDWEIINERILPSEWYPLALYKRCGEATFHILAQGNLELVRLRGRIQAKELFGKFYKPMIVARDPMTTLSRFVTVYSQFFNFITLKFVKADKNHAKIHHAYERQHAATMPYCHQLMGIFEMLVELAGGRNIAIELAAKEWEGAPTTIFEITWE